MTAEEEEVQLKVLRDAVQIELMSTLQTAGGIVPFANPFEGSVLFEAVHKACAAYIGPDFSQLNFEIGEVTPEMRRLGQVPTIHVSGPPELMKLLGGPVSDLCISDFIDVDVVLDKENAHAED